MVAATTKSNPLSLYVPHSSVQVLHSACQCVCVRVKMALSSTLSRLNLIPRPWLPYTVTTLRALKLKPHKPQVLRPMWAPLTLSSFSVSAQIHRPQDDNLVVLGIETSCDDTAAAVVCHPNFVSFTLALWWVFHCFWFCAVFNGFWLFLCVSMFFGGGVLGEEQWWDSQPSCVFSGILLLMSSGFSFIISAVKTFFFLFIVENSIYDFYFAVNRILVLLRFFFFF